MSVYIGPKTVMRGTLYTFTHKFLWKGAPRTWTLLPFLNTSQNISTSDMWWTNWKWEGFFFEDLGTAVPVFATNAPHI